MGEGRRYREEHLLPGHSPRKAARKASRAPSPRPRGSSRLGRARVDRNPPIPGPPRACACRLPLSGNNPKPQRVPTDSTAATERQYLGRVADLPAAGTLPGLHGGTGRAVRTTADPEVEATPFAAPAPGACVAGAAGSRTGPVAPAKRR